MKNKLKVRKKRFYFRCLFLCLVESKFSVLYRTQINELKDEINELTEKLRESKIEKTNIEEER